MNTHINRAHSHFLNTEKRSGNLSGFASHLANILRKKHQDWQTRRRDRKAIEQLLEMKEHHLADIGLTRNDVIWARHLPDHVDASSRLQNIARNGTNI